MGRDDPNSMPKQKVDDDDRNSMEMICRQVIGWRRGGRAYINNGVI